jgi:hypothetical protein
MGQFRKKPVVIEAVRVSKRMDLTAPDWWADAVQRNRVIVHGMGKFTRDQPWVEIQTLEGVMRGDDGDWIIRGGAGEFYPCKPAIFEATYEAADAPPPAADAVTDEMVEAARSAWTDPAASPIEPERWRAAIEAALAARWKA